MLADRWWARDSQQRPSQACLHAGLLAGGAAAQQGLEENEEAVLELVEDVHLAAEAAWDIKAPDVPGVFLDGSVESWWVQAAAGTRQLTRQAGTCLKAAGSSCARRNAGIICTCSR